MRFGLTYLLAGDALNQKWQATESCGAERDHVIKRPALRQNLQPKILRGDVGLLKKLCEVLNDVVVTDMDFGQRLRMQSALINALVVIDGLEVESKYNGCSLNCRFKLFCANCVPTARFIVEVDA